MGPRRTQEALTPLLHPGQRAQSARRTRTSPPASIRRERPCLPASGGAFARFDDDLGEFVLPYAAVSTARNPDAVLLELLRGTYEAAADTASWDRAILERQTPNA